MVSREKSLMRLSRPDIGAADLRAVAAVLRSGFLVQGARAAEFEKAIARAAGTKFAVCVSSGTAALHLAMLAAGIGPGDEVILPDFTFPATGNVVKLCGAVPVLVDVDPETFNIDPAKIEAAITPRTKALMPVHLFGNPADMDAIETIAAARKLLVIEDAACALGARWDGRPCGSFGIMSAFSFHARKIATTGEGGAVATNDLALADRLRSLRNHGAAPDDKARFIANGLNYRITDIQAALGVSQMARLKKLLSARKKLTDEYRRRLGKFSGGFCARVLPPAEPAWQSFVVRLKDGVNRGAVIEALRRKGIESGPATYALSSQPAFRPAAACLASETLAKQGLSLPLYPAMTKRDVAKVVLALEAACRA